MNQDNSSENLYRVVFRGDIRLSYAKADVLEALAQLFKTTEDRMEPFLSGKMRALSKEYSYDQANKIADLVTEAGARVQVVSESKWHEMNSDSAYEEAKPEGDASSAHPSNEQLDLQDESTDARNNEDEQQVKSEGEQSEADSLKKDELDIDTLRAEFVQKNTNYYFKRFKLFDTARGFKPSWHWPALFGFFFWACYRKMWLPAISYLAITVVLNFLLMSDLTYIAVKVIAAISANFLYYQHTNKQIVKANHNLNIIRRYGGVSGIALFSSVMFIFFLYNYLGSLYLQRVYEKNKAEFSAYLPDSNTQLIGDQPIDSIVNLSQQELNTSEALKRSAVRVKMFELMLQGQIDANSLYMVPLEIDSWGKPLEFIQQQNSLLLRSNGPDGVPNTPDDIVQPYNLSQ